LWTAKKRAVILGIIFSIIGIVFLIFYLDTKDMQRHLEIIKMTGDANPKDLMMNGTMSIQDYCDVFHSNDPTFCDAWKK
jgi:hypothetical protein